MNRKKFLTCLGLGCLTPFIGFGKHKVEINNKYYLLAYKYPITVETIESAVRRIGDSYKQAGLSENQMLALIICISSYITVSGDIIGNSLKTFFMTRTIHCDAFLTMIIKNSSVFNTRLENIISNDWRNGKIYFNSYGYLEKLS